MRLQLSTWPEVEEYLRRSTGIMIPIGSTEQHGPSGFIGTDAICAETLAFGAAELAGALAGPTIYVGMSEHHLAFPGSISLRPSTLTAVVRDYVISLARHGFDRFLFVNGHGGNRAAVMAGFFEAYSELSLAGRTEVRCRLSDWWAGPKAQELSRGAFGENEGSHATPSEISLAGYAHPDRFRKSGPTAAPRPPSTIYGAKDFRRRWPDGRMGSRPELASIDHGRRIFETVTAELAQIFREFMGED